MKRHVLLLIILVVANILHAQEIHHFRTDHPQGISVESSTANGLKVHYSVSEINIDPINSPNLPSENCYIAIPQGTTVSVEVTEKGCSTLNDINLLLSAEAIKNTSAFSSELVSIAQATQIRKLDVILLSITPYRYDPVQKTLKVVYDMEIDIRFEGGNGQFGETRYRNPDWDGILHDLVINSDMLPEAHYYDLVNKAARENEESCEYLIISPDDENILAWADTLKRFRTRQGIPTKVVTTTECGGNNTDAIKSYIQNAYEHWTIPPAAVMIFSGITDTLYIGEKDGIPGFPLVFLNFNDAGINYNYTSDNPYADMNGDSIPDLTLSRLTAFDIEDYQTQIKKIINYETNPPINPEYYRQPIITSGYENTKWFLITSQAVNGFYCKKLGKQPRNFYTLYEYSPDSVTVPDTAWSIGYNSNKAVDYFGPKGQNYIAQRPDTLSQWRSMFDNSYLLDALNQSSFLTFYRGHSGVDLWCCPWIEILDLLSLTHNTEPTFLLSIGCHTGQFFQAYFQGHIQKFPFIATYCNHKVGALGGIGASTVTHSWYNDILTWGIIDYFWPSFMPDLGSNSDPQFTRPAYALVAGKLFLNQHAFIPDWWPQKVTATQNVFHYLGEAYLNLYTEVPQAMTIEAGSFTDDQTTYSFTAEEGSLACLSHDDEILMVIPTTGEIQKVTLPYFPIGEHLLLTVTKRDRFRYEKEVTVISPDQPIHPVRFTLFPNPSDGIVNLTTDEIVEEQATIEVYNMLGESLAVKNLSLSSKSEIVTLDLSRLASGLYIIKLDTKKGNFSSKVSLK